MKSIRLCLSSIILAALVVPIIMTYQIFPGDTNYIQFALIFVLLFANFLVDILDISENLYSKLKYAFFWSILFLAVGGAFVSTIYVRHNVAPIFQVHDIILQVEAAIRFFIDGVNPWAATYHNTHMAEWNYSETMENPALYHFVMMPFYLIFSLPFYFLSNNLIGYFDARIPLYFLYFVVCLVPFTLVKDLEKRLLFSTLLALNPALFAYTLEGRSDIFMFAFLLVGFVLLGLGKYFLSGIFLAFAFAVKQSVWPLFPLYVAYVYFKSKSISLTIKRTASFASTFLIVTLPFFLWNPQAFLNSTILYLSGNTEHSYPISGYGLGMLLNQMNIIQRLTDSYPFIIWQAIIILPLLVFFLFLLKKNTNIRMLIFLYGLLIFVFWYLSRYFNNSHVAYITMVFITAYLWPTSKNSTK